MSTSRSVRRGAATATSTPTPPGSWVGRRRRAGWPRCAPSWRWPRASWATCRSTPSSSAAARRRCWAATGLAAVLDVVRDNFALARRRRGDHRGQPRVHVAGALRRASAPPATPGCHWACSRSAPAVLRMLDRIHSPGRAAAGRSRGAGRRLRAPQPRPDLRHAGGERRRPAALGRRGAVGRGRPRLGLRAGGRGRHRAGPPRQPRRDRPPGRRCAGPPLRAARRAAVGRRAELVRGVQLEPCPAGSAATTWATGTAASGGVPGPARTASSATRGGGTSSTPTPIAELLSRGQLPVADFERLDAHDRAHRGRVAAHPAAQRTAVRPC